MDKVNLVDFKHDWYKAFEGLKKILMKECSIIDNVQHIGSTAISDLKAKNIVDVQVLIPCFDNFDSLKQVLQSCGFSLIKNIKQDHVPFHEADYFESGWEKRFFNGVYHGQAFNIHVRLTNSKNAQFAKNFVKLLEDNADAKYAYSQFKERLANAGVDRMNYCLIKDSVIDIISLLFNNDVKGSDNE